MNANFDEAYYHQILQKKRILAICSSIIITTIVKRRARRRRNRKIWTRKWILNRPKQGAYLNLIAELRLGDTASYANFLRMDPGSFYELLNLVGASITKKDTRMRAAIPPGERLALTLRFLATGKHGDFKASTLIWGGFHIIFSVIFNFKACCSDDSFEL